LGLPNCLPDEWLPLDSDESATEMRIVLAGRFAGLGGIQTHLRSLSHVLADAGHELLLLSFGGAADERDDSSPIDSTVRIKYLSNRTAAGTLLMVRSAMREFRPQIYFACGTGWNLFAGAVVSRVPNRIFNEVMSGEYYGRHDSRSVVRRFFHRVVAQANPVARNFARSFGWTKPIEVIPAFSQPLENYPTIARDLVPYGTARAAVFGRLVPHKRVAWLVENWSRLKAPLRELHTFGSGPEEEVIRDLIAKNNLQDMVFCHGDYPHGQAYAELLASFDLTLLPTIGAEGAPLVLLESMACGVPFLATDAGGIRDYDNPDCLITPVGDPDAFLNAIETMAHRLAAGTVDHARLRAFYEAHFSHAALGPRWLAFFNSIVNP
jgi:glycosyltransferase involved in cell wall biosynthesis